MEGYALTLRFIALARFEGTLVRFGLVLFAVIARLPDRETRMVRPSRAEKPLHDSRKRCSDSIFRSVAAHGCDSNASAKDKSGASLTFKVNFSFTNQRADSFLHSGVDLEAKV